MLLMHSIHRYMHVFPSDACFFFLLHKHIYSHHKEALGYMAKLCTLSKVSHRHGRPIKRRMLYRQTHGACFVWANDLCSCEARYIHPAAPYITPQRSVQLPLMPCKHVFLCLCVCQLYYIVLQWNMDATAPLIFGRSSLTLKYWGMEPSSTDHYSICIIHLSCC